MSSGIVVKLWNVKAGKAGTRSGLVGSMDYIENEDKTSIEMPVGDKFTEEQLGRETQYVENDIKTFKKMLVTSINLSTTDTKEAVKEMLEVKKMYNKLDGRAAVHGVISLPVEESSLRNAEKLIALARDTVKELFPNNQAILAVHTNTDNLHIHFLVNTVGFDGRKIHEDRNFVRNVLQPTVNKYAVKYGFSENEQWKKKPVTIDKPEYEQYIAKIKDSVDYAVENSNTMQDFIQVMNEQGIKTRLGNKTMSFITGKMSRPIRSRRLGTAYTVEAIEDRILTRRDRLTLNTEAEKLANDPALIYTPRAKRLTKRYKDMTPEEKQEIVKALRAGRNPWRASANAAWQLSQLANDLNLTEAVKEYRTAYSADGTTEEILNGILAAKKRISANKKAAKRQYAQYLPMIKIYQEMQSVEKAAYLYEHGGHDEYRIEFERYRDLTRELKSGYDKTADDVAKYLADFDDYITYTTGQLAELSSEYKDTLAYLKKHGELSESRTLTGLVGAYDMKNEAKSTHHIRSEQYYIASQSSNVIAKITTYPQTVNGRVQQGFKAEIMDKYGNVLQSIDSKDGLSDFNRKLAEAGKQYNFTSCEKYKSLLQAKIVAMQTSDRHHEAGENSTKRTYKFTSAINLYSAKNQEGTYAVADPSGQSPYTAEVTTTADGSVTVTVHTLDGAEQGVYYLPPVKAESKDWTAINEMRAKYGFDEMVVYDSEEEAQKYAEEQQRQSEKQISTKLNNKR